MGDVGDAGDNVGEARLWVDVVEPALFIQIGEKGCVRLKAL